MKLSADGYSYLFVFAESNEYTLGGRGSLAEWSKAPDSSSGGAIRVGSNPTAVILAWILQDRRLVTKLVADLSRKNQPLCDTTCYNNQYKILISSASPRINIASIAQLVRA